jgi:hypothetical protein
MPVFWCVLGVSPHGCYLPSPPLPCPSLPSPALLLWFRFKWCQSWCWLHCPSSLERKQGFVVVQACSREELWSHVSFWIPWPYFSHALSLLSVPKLAHNRVCVPLALASTSNRTLSWLQDGAVLEGWGMTVPKTPDDLLNVCAALGCK